MTLIRGPLSQHPSLDVQFVPIYAVAASARQRLPKIGACIDYWAEWIGGGASAPR